MNGQAAAAVIKANPVFWQKKMQREGMHGISYERRDYELVDDKSHFQVSVSRGDSSHFSHI